MSLRPPLNCSHGCKCCENGMFTVGLSENAYLRLGVSKKFWNHPNDTPVYDILKILLPRPNRKKWQNANSIGDVWKIKWECCVLVILQHEYLKQCSDIWKADCTHRKKMYRSRLHEVGLGVLSSPKHKPADCQSSVVYRVGGGNLSLDWVGVQEKK